MYIASIFYNSVSFIHNKKIITLKMFTSAVADAANLEVFT